ncbi:MAG: family 43 glycosylhydrolase [bacterium]|nr:family 43 glycosylhydrolase [Candidatus Kapabacteria bacterium]
MNSHFVRASIIAIAFTLNTASSIAQWNPARDASLFTYVFSTEGHYVNDHCLIYADSLWHVFYIDGVILFSDDKVITTMTGWDRKGNEVSIGHATSPDLRSWTLREPALSVGPKGSRDEGHVYAPSVFRDGDRYYMAYTGNERSFEGGEHLLMAASTDLYNWTKLSDQPFITPDSAWAMYMPAGENGLLGGPYSGRDPHVITDPIHGYIAYYVARLRADSLIDSTDGQRSCVAAATSSDRITWIDRGPILVRSTYDDDQAFSWNHPESPCVVMRNGLYYLFWKGGVGTRYVISNDPLEFPDTAEYQLATTHASEIFEWNGEWFITSCSRNVDDIAHKRSDRTRGLYIARLEWNGIHPFVVPFDATSAVASDVLRKALHLMLQ